MFKRAFLFLNCMITVPHHSIIIDLVAVIALYNADIYGMKSAIVFYIFYIIFDTSPQRGGGYYQLSKKWQTWFRNYPGFRYLAQYFDASMIKERDLDANQQYIFAYHPHGVIGIGANVALNTNACGFEQIFPGLERCGVTLNATFLSPIFRDWLLFQGFISANKKTLINTLTATKSNSKKSLVLVPGGAAEALHAHPNVFKLHLKQRKGFIRLAMETKTAVIPCLGFGENEIFDTIYASSSDNTMTLWQRMLWNAQQRWMKCFSFSVPIISNIIPNRAKVTVVVGAPIEFDPSSSVDECHALYLKKVKALYDKHKDQLGHGHVPIEFV